MNNEQQTPEVIITNADETLCRECYEEQLAEDDATTWPAAVKKQGICNQCEVDVEQREKGGQPN